MLFLRYVKSNLGTPWVCIGLSQPMGSLFCYGEPGDWQASIPVVGLKRQYGQCRIGI